MVDLVNPDQLGYDPMSGLTPGSASRALAPVLGYAGDVLSGQAALDSLSGLLGSGSTRPLRSLREEVLDPEGLDRAAGIGLSFGPMMTKTTYHGTPHSFEPTPENPLGEFRNEAIGSGEGAQAYGWGHYVAGNPRVAEDYQRSLSGGVGGTTTFQGKSIFDHPDVSAENPHIQTAVNELNAKDGNPDKAIKQINHHLKTVNDTKKVNEINEQLKVLGEDSTNWAASERDLLQNAKQWIIDNKKDIGWEPAGHLLEVHVKPEEHELLDWDKLLSEQPEGVKEALNKLTGGDVSNESTMTGGHFYKYYVPGTERFSKDDQKASQILHEAGIPGIKYLDAGSRSAAENTPKEIKLLNSQILQDKADIQAHQNRVDSYGNEMNKETRDYHEAQIKSITQDSLSPKIRRLDDLQNERHITRNYVIFDPSNLRIIGKNGQRLHPVDHDPFETK